MEPQLLYTHSLPEVSGRNENPADQPAVPRPPKSSFRLILMIAALVVVAAVAIGVGVGIWHTKRDDPSKTRYNLLTDLHCHQLTHPVHRSLVHRFPAHLRRQSIYPLQ